MSWLDRFRKPNIIVHQPLNVVKDVNEKLDKEATERIRETLKDYALAIQNAEDETQNDSTRWERLLSLYMNIDLDEHISSLKDLIMSEVTQTPFKILDKNGNEKEEIKQAFEKVWFFDFCKYALECNYYPFGLLEFINPIEYGFEKVSPIDRFHIRPSLSAISIQKWQDNADFRYNKKPYSDTMMFIASNNYLGLYSVIAKKFILKREVNQYWAIYNELFTTPYWTVKTKFNDYKHRTDLLNWLTKRKHSGFAVVDIEDEIEQLSNSGSGWQSYKDFELSANDAMSKAFIGVTMVNTNGSSRSQAEVHERVKDKFIQSKRIWLQYLINEQLFPKMFNLGIIPKDIRFKWDVSEKFTLIQLVDAIQKLGGSFSFDEQELSEKTGFTLKEKKNDISSAPNFTDKK